jgi:hypothetical protein
MTPDCLTLSCLIFFAVRFRSHHTDGLKDWIIRYYQGILQLNATISLLKSRNI